MQIYLRICLEDFAFPKKFVNRRKNLITYVNYD